MVVGCYVYVHFSGLSRYENKQEPIFANSIMVYIIDSYDCP